MAKDNYAKQENPEEVCILGTNPEQCLWICSIFQHIVTKINLERRGLVLEQYLKSSVSKDPVVSVIFPGEEGEKGRVEMRKACLYRRYCGMRFEPGYQ